LFGKKLQKSSKKKKVEESSSESDSDIQLDESTDSDLDEDDEDAECLFCTGPFSGDRYGEIRVQSTKCYRLAHEDCGAEAENFVCPRKDVH
jgi:hypothetical protein